MPHPPARFLTPLVLLSAASVVATGLALSVLDVSQAWKALLAVGFIGGAGALIHRSHNQPAKDDLVRRSLKRTRAVLIVAAIMLASQLAFAAARAADWFGEDAERWTLQWLFVALTAAAIELFSARSEKKADKPDED